MDLERISRRVAGSEIKVPRELFNDAWGRIKGFIVSYAYYRYYGVEKSDSSERKAFLSRFECPESNLKEFLRAVKYDGSITNMSSKNEVDDEVTKFVNSLRREEYTAIIEPNFTNFIQDIIKSVQDESGVKLSDTLSLEQLTGYAYERTETLSGFSRSKAIKRVFNLMKYQELTIKCITEDHQLANGSFHDTIPPYISVFLPKEIYDPDFYVKERMNTLSHELVHYLQYLKKRISEVLMLFNEDDTKRTRDIHREVGSLDPSASTTAANYYDPEQIQEADMSRYFKDEFVKELVGKNHLRNYIHALTDIEFKTRLSDQIRNLRGVRVTKTAIEVETKDPGSFVGILWDCIINLDMKKPDAAKYADRLHKKYREALTTLMKSWSSERHHDRPRKYENADYTLSIGFGKIPSKLVSSALHEFIEKAKQWYWDTMAMYHEDRILVHFSALEGAMDLLVAIDDASKKSRVLKALMNGALGSTVTVIATEADDPDGLEHIIYDRTAVRTQEISRL